VLPRSTRTIAAALTAAALALTAAGCGSSDHAATTTPTADGAAATAAAAKGAKDSNAVDRAFVEQMIPHHQMAMEMARTALTSAQHPEVKQLARNILRTQSGQITELARIADAMGVKPATMPMGSGAAASLEPAAKALGLKVSQLGMSMDTSALANNKGDDRMFIYQMIPHHQGGVAMSRAEIKGGKNDTLKAIAGAIIAGQTAEIAQMYQWRAQWFGATTPARSVAAS